MKYTTLGIVMHGKCNAECDICSECCSPARKDMLNIERVKQLIVSSKGTTIDNIAFTGGEPFLEFENLVELISYTTMCGFSSSVVTNGFWATTESVTDAMLKKLIDCGLGRINISYDLHHSKFVKQSNINHIIDVCTKYRLPYLVVAVKLKNEKIGDLVDGFSPDCGLTNLMVAPCEPAGRAKENFDEDAFLKNKPIHDQQCQYDGILTITPDGNVYPCCAHQVFGSALSIGNYMEMDVKEMLKRLKNNGLLYILRNYGLDPFLDMNPSIQSSLPEYVASPCEICEALFADGVTPYLNGVTEFIKEHVQTD